MKSAETDGGVGARIRAARQAAGFRFAVQAASKFKWVTSTYTAHENGTRAPDKSLVDYARAFGVDYDWLRTGIGRVPGAISNTIERIKDSTRPKSVISVTGIDEERLEEIRKKTPGFVSDDELGFPSIPTESPDDDVIWTNTTPPEGLRTPDNNSIALVGKVGAQVIVGFQRKRLEETPTLISGEKHPKFRDANHFAFRVTQDLQDEPGAESIFEDDIIFCVEWAQTGYSPTPGYIVVIDEHSPGIQLTQRTLRRIVRNSNGLAFAANGWAEAFPIKPSSTPRDPIYKIVGLVYSVTRMFKVMK